MRLQLIRVLMAAALGSPLVAQNASATGNLDCSIDDNQLNFELFALTGGTGGIVQITQASVELKVGDDKALRSKRAIEQKNIEQQWIHGNELRIQFGIPNTKGEPVGRLILIGTYKAADDTYAGRYALTVFRSGGGKEFKGRMKCG